MTEALESRNFLLEANLDSVLLFFRFINLALYFKDNRTDQPRLLYAIGIITGFRVIAALRWVRKLFLDGVLILGEPACPMEEYQHGGRRVAHRR